MKRFFLLILILISTNSIAQKLSRSEKKIVTIIEQNNNEAIRFLEKVVNINSGSMNHDGVKEVGMVFKEQLENIGFGKI